MWGVSLKNSQRKRPTKNFARFHNHFLRFTIKRCTGTLSKCRPRLNLEFIIPKTLISHIFNTSFKNTFQSYIDIISIVIIIIIIIIINDPYNTPGCRRRPPVFSSALGSLLMIWLFPNSSIFFSTLEAGIASSCLRDYILHNRKVSNIFGLLAVQSTRTFLKCEHKDGERESCRRIIVEVGRKTLSVKLLCSSNLSMKSWMSSLTNQVFTTYRFLKMLTSKTKRKLSFAFESRCLIISIHGC